MKSHFIVISSISATSWIIPVGCFAVFSQSLESYLPAASGFGSSRCSPADQTKVIASIIQGIKCYADLVYYTGQLTSKLTFTVFEFFSWNLFYK
jgi:hypothetical protein